ncbi:DMT family transporter [Pelagovum pacificum]|uniref:DMT family transporter n=1 Tax=Pelagovum pacificum TaxID=2588711 RepID=A0A5C5GI54_9RHOB|nr:DMT family transporter [Pelagovum pacificum]QQA42952.1 DMT family transporter [Pelagovum pacificum]TNY33904.1 DMT family transporter [Pelagovum pacificum]
MQTDRTTRLATLIVFVTGTFWGFYWLPVRHLTDAGLPGAWGTLAITAAAALALLPLALRHRTAIRRAGPVALASIALGGAAFALYSVAFVYGRVAIVILLYFLTPVWSTLIGRYLMGWRTTRMRLLAIVVGLLGLLVMLGAEGNAPIPRSAGEWMGLVSGILWSVATTGIRTRSSLDPVPSAFVFVVGAVLATLLMAPLLEPLPVEPPRDAAALAAIAIGTGIAWWALSIGGLMWATVRLEPARVGILLMAEVLVGAVSAAVLAAEHLHPLEIAGGALVLIAGILEVWPTTRRPS